MKSHKNFCEDTYRFVIVDEWLMNAWIWVHPDNR